MELHTTARVHSCHQATESARSPRIPASLFSFSFFCTSCNTLLISSRYVQNDRNDNFSHNYLFFPSCLFTLPLISFKTQLMNIPVILVISVISKAVRKYPLHLLYEAGYLSTSSRNYISPY